MLVAEKIKSITYVKGHMPELIDQLAVDRTPLVVTQNGDATAVIQDIRSFEETQETMALLRILAIGAEHIKAGRTKPLDEVLDNLEAALDEAR
jgi:prevent-host-death family protein